MKLSCHPINISRVHTLVYHLPGDEKVTINVESPEQFYDLGLEVARICDTSEVDGVLHVFPYGFC